MENVQSNPTGTNLFGAGWFTGVSFVRRCWSSNPGIFPFGTLVDSAAAAAAGTDLDDLIDRFPLPPLRPLDLERGVADRRRRRGAAGIVSLLLSAFAVVKIATRASSFAFLVISRRRIREPIVFLASSSTRTVAFLGLALLFDRRWTRAAGVCATAGGRLRLEFVLICDRLEPRVLLALPSAGIAGEIGVIDCSGAASTCETLLDELSAVADVCWRFADADKRLPRPLLATIARQLLVAPNRNQQQLPLSLSLSFLFT